MIVVPVYDMILASDANIYFNTSQVRRNAGDKGLVAGERVVLIVARDSESFKDLSSEGFYPVGISGEIREINNQGYVVIHTGYRVNVENIEIGADKSISLSMTRRSDIEDMSRSVEKEKLEGMLAEMRKFASGFDWADSAEYWLRQIDSLERAACVMSPWMDIPNEERYAILAEDSRLKRAELIEEALYGFMEVGRITNEAMTSQQEEHQKMYREQAIKRQMEHLQKELDEMHPENVTDIQKFEQKIAESGMNETARKEAEKVLNRLKQEGSQSAESGMLYDYLDFVTGLSWKKEEASHIDLGKAREVLDEDHFGLDKVKDRIIQQIAVMNLKNEQSGSILLFVGAPGTGKTSIGRSIARALGREYVRVSLGGVHDESDIRGHRRTYIGAMPGRVMDGIHKSGVSNPVMVLDEVDKLSASYNGSPASALLEVLDPEQNNTFTDHYMNVPYDLSDVMFICTANTTDTIPEPLLNRMEVIQFSGYTPVEKLSIAREHLVPKSMDAMGIDPEIMEVTDEALKKIISDYTMEAGVRGLRKRIDTLCRVLAVKVATDPERKLKVTPEVVDEEIDARPIQHSRILPEPKAGVVTGLAWTPVGGEILYIETMLTKGRGETIITGQLGDVMKESARIAVSLVKTIFPDKAELFAENDLHIHVPEGAVPKDGPSAGIALTTALSSLVTGHVVDPHIAMTGEVALRGTVTLIGGLPEKLMAAERAGITKVFIPDDNEYDLKDVADEVKDKIEIRTVSKVEDVLRATGILA
ncbi:MAG: endopeptidase La [Clostridiales bacterium]|nr:endopeptidase La [Clostridiales bacterium]MBR0469160.1 endopeptidase La [Mogibacterium sp.]